jgi:hypothetical protein
MSILVGKVVRHIRSGHLFTVLHVEAIQDSNASEMFCALLIPFNSEDTALTGVWGFEEGYELAL